jgi:hypothetical protein
MSRPLALFAMGLTEVVEYTISVKIQFPGTAQALYEAEQAGMCHCPRCLPETMSTLHTLVNGAAQDILNRSEVFKGGKVVGI